MSAELVALQRIEALLRALLAMQECRCQHAQPEHGRDEWKCERCVMLQPGPRSEDVRG